MRSEGEGLATTRPRTTTTTNVSFDAYRSTVGGSITIAVTGTDNPVPTQSDRNTPPSAPVIPASSAPAATPPADSETITKETQPKP